MVIRIISIEGKNDALKKLYCIVGYEGVSENTHLQYHNLDVTSEQQ